MADGGHTPAPFPKTSVFAWTEPRRRAAVLVAEDDLSNEEIGAVVGVTARTLTTWKQRAEFTAQVAHHVEDLNRAMTRLSIAKKHKRLTVLDDLHDKTLRVIEERAAEYAALAEQDASAPNITSIRSMIGDKTVPAGGGTGLLVRQLKQAGAGRTAPVIEEFAVDTALIKQIQSLQEQAAKELGQWVERSEADVRTSVVQLVGIDSEAL